MATPAEERLQKLLAGKAKPAPPDHTKSHFADSEIQSIEQREQRKEQQKWQIPDAAQHPRKVRREPPRTGAAFEQVTSSEDDDDYISAFKKKPSMQPTKPNKRAKPERRVIPEPDAFDYPKDAHIPPPMPLEVGPKVKVPENWNSSGVSNMETPSKKGDLPNEDGEGNPVTGHFCIFQLVAKFPYKYMVDANDRVSRRFFANNKFYNRKWDIYYIDPPGSLLSKAILLLPYNQVKELIDDISSTFKIDISVPPEPFTVSFFKDGTPQPTFLGSSQCREDVGDLQASIRQVSEDYGEPPPNASLALNRSFAAFRAKVDKAITASKKKSTATKMKKANDRFLNIQDWVKQLKRTQRYFGVRPRAVKPPEPDPNTPWAEQEEFRRQQLKKCHIVLDPLDVNEKAPFTFENEPIIISVDVEAYERNHELITEIGISTVDTLDLVDIPPGPGGVNWIKQFRSRHFRIKKYAYLRNTDFCRGNPEAFDFGTSELVTREEAVHAVDACFEYPFSVDFRHDGTQIQYNSAESDTDLAGAEHYEPMRPASLDKPFSIDGVDAHGPTNADHHVCHKAVALKLLHSSEEDVESILTKDVASPVGPSSPVLVNDQKGPNARKILLVGHDLGTDLAYLKKLGSKIFSVDRSTYPIPAMETLSQGTGEVSSLSCIQTKAKLFALSGNSQVLASIIEALDTAVLYRVLKKESQIRGLASVLADLGICGWNLHNAGNDARYTLEALVALVIKARISDDEEQAKKEAEMANLLENGNQETEPELETARLIEEKLNDARREAEAEHGTREKDGPTATQTTSSRKVGALNGVNTRGIFATSLPFIKQDRPNEDADAERTVLERQIHDRLEIRKEAEYDPYLAAQMSDSSPPNEKQYGTDAMLTAAFNDPEHDDGGSPPVPFGQAYSESIEKKQAKKQNSSKKRRDKDLAIREPNEGPCGWAAGGVDGFAGLGGDGGHVIE